MSSWPSLDRADDERLASSLAAGDSDALIQLLDRYAARLYDYSHALLRDQESAAGALHDALVAASAHVVGLREPPRFRSWLYALVRNECLRRLRDPDRPTERFEAPEVEDVFLNADEKAHRLETRQVVHAALAGLRGHERESLDLMLRHGLDAGEIGGVIGVPAQEATDLTWEANRRLDDALAAAVIARAGHQGCPEAAEVAGDGWPPVPAVVHRLIKHIDGCHACTERRHRTVSTGRLLQVLPVALMPTDLRGWILTTITAPESIPELDEIVRRAEPFDPWGWPVPLETPKTGAGADERRKPPPRVWPAIATAAAVLLVVFGGFLLMPDSSKSRSSAQASPGASSSPAADPSDPGGQTPTESESPSPTPTPTDSTSPSPSESPSSTPSASASPSQRPTRTPSPPASSQPPAKPGTLVAGGCGMEAGESSCPVTLRAVGGKVSWSVSGTSGGVTASGSGTLAKGGSASITVTRSGACTGSGGSGTVTISPGASAQVSWKCAPPDGDGGQNA
ncbi:sigma-70 family RNA polymerase sigma factor [Spirillospora sp. CA-294931]|uniref:sigma-70 family RNA polymerase sigma factor n=1 Tax=Spirillospora sp. CA-294931 TaxID=3240042 RepID=UPI003D8DABF5